MGYIAMSRRFDALRTQLWYILPPECYTLQCAASGRPRRHDESTKQHAEILAFVVRTSRSGGPRLRRGHENGDHASRHARVSGEHDVDYRRHVDRGKPRARLRAA